MVWSTLSKIIYLGLVEVLAFSMISTPVYALSNYTGYVRVLPSTAVSTYVAANAPVWRSAVATAALAPTVASTAIRIVSGPIGWGALAVTAGLTLAQMYYSSTDLQQLKTNALAAQPSVSTIPGYTVPSGGNLAANQCSPTLYNGCFQVLYTPSPLTQFQCNSLPATLSALPVPAGWTRAPVSSDGINCLNVYTITYNGSNGAQLATTAPPTTITQPTFETFIAGLPSNSPLKPDNKVQPVGTEVTPTAASSTTTVSVVPTDIPSTVKKASDVLPTDTVVNPNVPAPVGVIAQPAPATATQTTTTTSTTNPDGSVTQAQTENGGAFSCNVGNHDQRSMGSILTDHMNVWKNVGILGTLNNLKNIVWPNSLPTYTFGPTLLGTFTLNFNTWSWVFADVRSIMIASTGLYGVVIVFRGKAST